MLTFHPVDLTRMEMEAARCNIDLPIEQTAAWAAYDEEIDGREPWGAFLVKRDDVLVALISLTRNSTHGFDFLWAHHAPVWLAPPTPGEEEEFCRALSTMVRGRDSRIVFARLALMAETPSSTQVLTTIPYDTTVIVDLTGTPEDILSRMKTRGRRDVRKAIRESGLTCADETERALVSFSEYYQVMEDTAKRDGFVPHPLSHYEAMVNALGTRHCRIFAGRVDGDVVCWTLATISGTVATRYYAALSTDAMRRHAADTLMLYECTSLGEAGCTSYDLMAIGSPFSPTLNGLNVFKTKFAKEVTPVAPDRDIAIRPVLYGSLKAARTVQHWLRRA